MRILSAAKRMLRTKMRAVVKKMQQRMGIWRTYAVQTVRTSAPCVENVCMRADVKDTSYQALNLVIHLPMETKFAC